MAKSSNALDRLLHSPNLARVVPRLPALLLHRAIQQIGIEDCVELVAHATPAQIAGVLDMEVWRPQPGQDDAFDADRFGQWLVVLMEAGPEVAAEKLAGVDPDLIAAALAAHVAVFDAAAVTPYISLEGDLTGGRESTGVRAANIGGYVVDAIADATWDAISGYLRFLAAERDDDFQTLMRRCVRLSNRGREEDGFHDLLDDREQHLADLAADRDSRRETQGFITAAQAAAFLADARTLSLSAAQAPVSAVARAYFRALRGDTHRPAQALAPIVDREFAEQEALGFLANVLFAGCTLQGRAFTLAEAVDAVTATCALGRERWPAAWTGPAEAGHHGSPEPIGAFQVGWRVLHEDVALYAARELQALVKTIAVRDRDVQLRLIGLRRQLERAIEAGTPWTARPALDAMLLLDAVAWAGLVGLIDACPVIHLAVRMSHSPRGIDPGDFQFIGTGDDIAAVRAFIARLPELLSPASRPRPRP